jgi:hypothetical protein
MAPAASKVYDETIIVALLMALKSKGGTYTEPLKDMVALNGNRTLSSFEHSLRAANKLAGEFNAKKASGQALTPADMPNESASGTTSTTATPKKRGGEFVHHVIILQFQ